MIVVGNTLAKDLKKIMYAYQKKGIEIYVTKGYEMAKRVKIRKSLCMEKE